MYKAFTPTPLSDVASDFFTDDDDDDDDEDDEDNEEENGDFSFSDIGSDDDGEDIDDDALFELLWFNAVSCTFNSFYWIAFFPPLFFKCKFCSGKKNLWKAFWFLKILSNVIISFETWVLSVERKTSWIMLFVLSALKVGVEILFYYV